MPPRPTYTGGRTTFDGRHAVTGERQTFTGQQPPAQQPPKPSSGGGFWHSVAKYSGAQLVGNLAKDVGSTAVGIGPGLYHAGHALEKGTAAALTGDQQGVHAFNKGLEQTGKGVAAQYKDFYGHNVGHHLYTHPLQPLLDLATVVSGGASGLAKAGKLAADAGAISQESRLAQLGDRATLETRSPRNIATGKGPVHTEITSAKPTVKARELAGPKVTGTEGLGVGRVRVGGELKRYGKQIQSRATQAALGRMAPFEVYSKATRRLSHDEWTALHLRAMDIHPDDLAQLWKGTPAEKMLTPKVRQLTVAPSARMQAAEPAARMIADQGAALSKESGLLKDETATARPALTKQHASDLLGRPVREIHGDPYYFPHTPEPVRANPLQASGGGKAVPRKLGSSKQNLGILFRTGKLHLRSDVLGPEFLRRVKYAKYDEIHNGLVRGAIPVTHQEIVERYAGRLPKGYEYVREKASTRVPPTIRGEGDQHVPIEKLIPNPEDLHDSQLARDGFTTTDESQALQTGGHYHMVPSSTAKAATGEFTHVSALQHALVTQPLKVWRSAVLGLRVGFLTNNLVGNSIMYAAHTTGKGAFRDLLGAIIESHGRDTALKILNDPATPAQLRTDLYKEFFPEQIGGTFGRTQSPATSQLHLAGRKSVEAARAVTGAIPRLTSKVAEEYPRRALIRNTIRNSPEFKQAYKALPAQTRSFEQAARKILEGDGGPAYQRYVSKQVDHALGNYTNMSPFERNVLRNALPFYSWYRAIVQTTYHLAADTPGRALLLQKLGQIGQEYEPHNVPSYLRGFVPTGFGPSGTIEGVATQGLNPYATLEQLREGALSDVTSLGLNPFVLAAAKAYADGTAHGKNVSLGRIAYDSLVAMAQGLPPSRLLMTPKPSKLYPNTSRYSNLLAYLGVPVKDYSPGVAAQQAAQGR